MVRLNERYITDREGHRVEVILSIRDWEALIEEMEEMADIIAYDRAKEENDESIPFDQAIEEIERGRGK